jgi:hypothetical protein
MDKLSQGAPDAQRFSAGGKQLNIFKSDTGSVPQQRSRSSRRSAVGQSIERLAGSFFTRRKRSTNGRSVRLARPDAQAPKSWRLDPCASHKETRLRWRRTGLQGGIA